MQRNPHSLSNVLLTKAATLHDVASLAGVTPMTVSNVLRGKGRMSESTRQRVLQAARQLSYTPNSLAQRLATGQVANYIDLYASLPGGGVRLLTLKRIQDELASHGYDVPIHSYGVSESTTDADRNNNQLMRKLRQSRPRAIVCATPYLDGEALLELQSYLREGGHVVCYDEVVDLSCDNLVFDAEGNIHQATQHLLELGHRRIGLFQHGARKPHDAILQGFKRALADFNIKPQPQWLFGSLHSSEEGGLALAEQFLKLKKSERPTAMIVVNDVAALAFMIQLQHDGVKVPEHLSIIGHDDLSLAKCCPAPLTTVSYPVEKIAHEVTRLLIDRLQREYSGSPRRVVVDGELIVRESTGRVKP